MIKLRRFIIISSQVFYILILLLLFMTLYIFFHISKLSVVGAKPVIYVYNDTNDKTVSLTLIDTVDNHLDIFYPDFTENNTWVVDADASGDIRINNRSYPYLYWEDEYDIPFGFEFSEGFCVKSENTVEFLERALSEIGLNEIEQADFITYWLPSLVKNRYNIITFNPCFYRDYYQITSSVNKIDNIITVFMVFKASDDFIDIAPQDLNTMNNKSRDGLTIVEWGGTDYDRKNQ